MGITVNDSEEKRPYKRIPISRATLGMELAQDIYSRNNQVILNKHSILDAQKISKIMFYSIDTIIVYEQEQEETEDLSLVQQLKSSVEFREFSKNYDHAVSALQNTINAMITEGTEIDEDYLITEVDRMVGASGSRTKVFNMLHCIREYDEMTYMHSVNVSLIAGCFAKWLELGEESERMLTLAGLLHDIGKTVIPREIILKPDSLTAEEYKIVKTHTLRGYELLKDKNLDDRVKMAALQHHERADGSGYPFGKNGEQIENFAMIIAIADVYDAMTSDRIYRPRVCPFDVVKMLQNDDAHKYNPKFLIPLLEQITQVFINHNVRLSNDQVGKIVLLNNAELSKPVVQVDDIFVDLAKHRDIKITEIV